MTRADANFILLNIGRDTCIGFRIPCRLNANS